MSGDLQRDVKAKSMGVSKVRVIALDSIDVDFMLVGPATLEIFCSKHDVGTLLIITFIGNSDVSMQ